MNKKYFLLPFFLFLAINIFFTNKALASEASIQVSPLQGRYDLGQIFTAKLWVKTGNYSLGKITADISFPEDFLEVVSFKLADFASSSGRNYYDNKKGYIYIRTSLPNSLPEDNSLASIVFKVKQEGSARVSLMRTSQAFTIQGLQIPLRLAAARYQLLASNKVAKKEEVKYVETEDGGPGGIKNTVDKTSILIGQQPILKGKTDVPGARIEFEVDHGLIVDRVFADSQGEWKWYAPKLLPGNYVVKVTALHPKDSKKRFVEWVEMKKKVLDASKSLYKVRVVTSTLSRARVGSKLPFSLKVFNLAEDNQNQVNKTKQTKLNLDLSYYAEGPNKDIIYQNEEKVVYTGAKMTLNRYISIPNNAQKGQYTLYVSLKMDDELIDMDIVKFKVGSLAYIYYIITAILITVTAGIIMKFIFISKKKSRIKQKNRGDKK